MEIHKYAEIKQHSPKQAMSLKKKHTREIRKQFEMNENEKTMYQNSWDTEE